MSPFLGTRGAGSNRAFGYAGAAAPAQVTGLTATDFGTSRAYNNGRIDLSWTAPANNGATISGYLIERSTDGSSYSTLVANTGTTGTTYSDTSLLSNQIYYYRVSAINAAGTGLASTAANATSTTVPQAPTIGTATAGNATATVTYTAGATGGKAVSTFTATSSPGSLTGTGASPITVSSLSNGTAYTFSVTATNANGTSSASNASNSVTPSLPKTPNVEFVVVAGGGGGGRGAYCSNIDVGLAGGGGGAGGVLYSASTAVNAGTTYTVTVGGGGAGNTAANYSGSLGSTSSFLGTSTTGGGGGGRNDYPGTNGGSGGGAGSRNSTFGTGTSGQGNNGAAGAAGQASGATSYGGGGGGKGGAGTQGGVNSVGQGGSPSTFIGLSVARGGPSTGLTPSEPGSGGGAQYEAVNGRSGNAGTVRLRYSNSYADAVSTTGSPAYSNSGGYKMYTWTGSGSITF